MSRAINRTYQDLATHYDTAILPTRPRKPRDKAKVEVGVLVIRAERFRTREQNREDARDRLAELVRRATSVPRARIATRPTRASKERRIEAKVRRSTTKRQRRARPELE